MRSRIRTIILIIAVLGLLAFVEGLHGSAGAQARQATAQSREAAAQAPEATAARSWTFSGKGPRKLGTFKLRHSATLRWKSSGGRLLIADSRGFRLLYTKARRGKLRISRGTYRRLTLSARGSWKITVRERR
jgi:hypothetical protein